MSSDCAAHAHQFERLANAPVDPTMLPDRLLDALGRVVPFDSYCWGAIDPRSLLPVRGGGTTFPSEGSALWEVQELMARSLEPSDVRAMARSGRSVALLSEIVGKRKEQSPIYRRLLRPSGIEHQLRSTLAIDGAHWGQLYLGRRPESADFSSGEAALVEALAPHLAHAFRRRLLAEPGATGSASPPAQPGVILLDEDHELASISPEAEHWLTEWGLSDLKRPPVAIAAAVGAARALADGHSRSVPSARVRLRTGAWLHVHATHLTELDRKTRTVVVLERARTEHVAPLVARANQLTPRETEIALLVLRGLSTGEIASTLFISPYTVQDHLKSIFEKVGVRSRRELATEIFEPHYQAG